MIASGYAEEREGDVVLYLRFTFLTEIWRSHGESNPGFSLERAAS